MEDLLSCRKRSKFVRKSRADRDSLLNGKIGLFWDQKMRWESLRMELWQALALRRQL